MLLFTYQHNTNKLGSQLLHCITGYQTKENTKPWHGYVLWQTIHTGFFWRQKFPDSKPTYERIQKTASLFSERRLSFQEQPAPIQRKLRLQRAEFHATGCAALQYLQIGIPLHCRKSKIFCCTFHKGLFSLN